MSKISVIILAYNVEAYVGRCFESVLAQTFTDFEVVCVDDGSTDSTGDICERYAEKDARVKVFHIANGGISRARNFALELIHTEWFAYVDADDWVEPEFLEVLYRNALENFCDISACNFQRNETYGMGSQDVKEEKIIFSSSAECIHSFICSENSLQGMVWNKIYRTEKYRNVRFDESVKMTEDCLYTYHIMRQCEKACYVSLPLYHWFLRKNSESQSRVLDCDFTPANVFLDLYKETWMLQNEEVTRVLQQNYIKCVLKIIIFSVYDSINTDAQDAKKRCREWKKDVWKFLDLRTRMKYILVMFLPWMLPVIKLMRK